MAPDIVPADFQHGPEFADKLTRIYPQHDLQVLAQLQTSSWMAYWHNPLIEGGEADDLPSGEWVEGLQIQQLPRSAALTHHPAAANGQIYIQNVSSFFAVQLLDPRPEEEVLDMAAAPGGKSIAMAAAMQNRGRLAVVEVVKGRFHRLRANLQRCGVTCAEFYLRDGRGVGRAVPERFDRVLVDAPCSSESHMRWDAPKTYQHWSPKKVKECQRKQIGLLRSGYQALKRGGTLLYCTCSFSPEENELVVAKLLSRTDAQVVPLDRNFSHHQPGLTHWQNKVLPEALSGTLRVLPQQAWDGFYLAKLYKP